MDNIYKQILQWRAIGRTVEQTHIYFKDYVEYNEVKLLFTMVPD
jgi:hypothetical protein